MGIGGAFGVGPGFGRAGDLTGILTGDRISARTADDWTGALDGDPPIGVDLSDLDTLSDGTPVALSSLLQVTPWDRSGRWIVVQDEAGAGLWIDTEAWGLRPGSDLGTVADWEGELRRDPDGPYLRAWREPLPTGAQRPAQLGPERVDGALISTTISGFGLGEGEPITDQGDLLDDRFVDLADLPDPASVTAVVRGVDPARLAVLPEP